MSALVSNTGSINFVFDDDSAISGMDDATPKLNVRYNLNGQIMYRLPCMYYDAKLLYCRHSTKHFTHN